MARPSSLSIWITCTKALYSPKHHFADDTSIIQSNPLLQKLSKQVNKDLSNLSNWLKTNKLSLNVKKTELVIFGQRKLKTDPCFKFKFEGKRLISTHFVKYLGVLTDEHLLWNKQIVYIKMRLNQAIGLLNRLWINTNFNILKTAYYSLFEPHLQYGRHLCSKKKKKKKKNNISEASKPCLIFLSKDLYEDWDC